MSLPQQRKGYGILLRTCAFPCARTHAYLCSPETSRTVPACPCGTQTGPSRSAHFIHTYLRDSTCALVICEWHVMYLAGGQRSHLGPERREWAAKGGNLTWSKSSKFLSEEEASWEALRPQAGHRDGLAGDHELEPQLLCGRARAAVSYPRAFGPTDLAHGARADAQWPQGIRRPRGGPASPTRLGLWSQD